MSVASSQYGGYNQHGYPQMYPMYQMYPAGYVSILVLAQYTSNS